MAKSLKPIGYFNDFEDVFDFYKNQKPEDVIDAVYGNKGAFHRVDADYERTFADFSDENGRLTKDGEFFVVFPSDLDIIEKKGTEDLFVDVYVVSGDDGEYDDGFCDEWCPECDSEVELPRKLGVYRCPNCGKWMVNCSMCYLTENGRCSWSNCPLSYEARRRNSLEEKHPAE